MYCKPDCLASEPPVVYQHTITALMMMTMMMLK